MKILLENLYFRKIEKNVRLQIGENKDNKMSNGTQQQQQQQRTAYVEAHAVAHAAVQQHMAQQAAQARLAGPGPTATPQPPNPTFTLPDDGLGYDDGVRVLRSIGTWYIQDSLKNSP